MRQMGRRETFRIARFATDQESSGECENIGVQPSSRGLPLLRMPQEALSTHVSSASRTKTAKEIGAAMVLMQLPREQEARVRVLADLFDAVVMRVGREH